MQDKSNTLKRNVKQDKEFPLDFYKKELKLLGKSEKQITELIAQSLSLPSAKDCNSLKQWIQVLTAELKFVTISHQNSAKIISKSVSELIQHAVKTKNVSQLKNLFKLLSIFTFSISQKLQDNDYLLKEYKEAIFSLLKEVIKINEIAEINLIREISMFIYTTIKGQDRVFSDFFTELGDHYINQYKKRKDQDKKQVQAIIRILNYILNNSQCNISNHILWLFQQTLGWIFHPSISENNSTSSEQSESDSLSGVSTLMEKLKQYNIMLLQTLIMHHYKQIHDQIISLIQISTTYKEYLKNNYLGQLQPNLISLYRYETSSIFKTLYINTLIIALDSINIYKLIKVTDIQLLKDMKNPTFLTQQSQVLNSVIIIVIHLINSLEKETSASLVISQLKLIFISINGLKVLEIIPFELVIKLLVESSKYVMNDFSIVQQQENQEIKWGKQENENIDKKNDIQIQVLKIFQPIIINCNSNPFFKDKYFKNNFFTSIILEILKTKRLNDIKIECLKVLQTLVEQNAENNFELNLDLFFEQPNIKIYQQIITYTSSSLQKQKMASLEAEKILKKLYTVDQQLIEQILVCTQYCEISMDIIQIYSHVSNNFIMPNNNFNHNIAQQYFKSIGYLYSLQPKGNFIYELIKIHQTNLFSNHVNTLHYNLISVANLISNQDFIPDKINIQIFIDFVINLNVPHHSISPTIIRIIGLIYLNKNYQNLMSNKYERVQQIILNNLQSKNEKIHWNTFYALINIEKFKQQTKIFNIYQVKDYEQMIGKLLKTTKFLKVTIAIYEYLKLVVSSNDITPFISIGLIDEALQNFYNIDYNDPQIVQYQLKIKEKVIHFLFALFDNNSIVSLIEKSQSTLMILHEPQFLTSVLRIISSYLVDQSKIHQQCEVKWIKIDESLSLEEQLKLIENTDREVEAFKYSEGFEQFAKVQLLIVKGECQVIKDLMNQIMSLCCKIKDVMDNCEGQISFILMDALDNLSTIQQVKNDIVMKLYTD